MTERCDSTETINDCCLEAPRVSSLADNALPRRQVTVEFEYHAELVDAIYAPAGVVE
jgi:hypothetical protein